MLKLDILLPALLILLVVTAGLGFIYVQWPSTGWNFIVGILVGSAIIGIGLAAVPEFIQMARKEQHGD